MATLYELTNDLLEAQRSLNAMLDDGTIGEETYNNTLASMLDDHGVKTVGVIAHIKNLQSERDMYKAEIDKLQKRLKSASSSVDFYEGYLLTQMLKLNQIEAGEGVHTAKIKKGAKRCEITDIDALDMDYKIVKSTVTADKRAITQAIKAGESIKGAAMVQAPDSVRIN
tara:strand:- start:674 stop:1180 length:507 start_codon:yes stop_codon:yes gene_type:complete